RLSLRFGKEAGKSLRCSHPKPAIARAKGGGNLSRRQPVGHCVVSDAAGRGIELIETLPGANVDASIKVFGNCQDDVARQTLRSRITRKTRALRFGAIDPNQAAARRSQPDDAMTIGVNVRHSA